MNKAMENRQLILDPEDSDAKLSTTTINAIHWMIKNSS